MKKVHPYFGLSAMTLAFGSALASVPTSLLLLPAYWQATPTVCLSGSVTDNCTLTIPGTRCNIINTVHPAFGSINAAGTMCTIPLYYKPPTLQ